MALLPTSGDSDTRLARGTRAGMRNGFESVVTCPRLLGKKQRVGFPIPATLSPLQTHASCRRVSVLWGFKSIPPGEAKKKEAPCQGLVNCCVHSLPQSQH